MNIGLVLSGGMAKGAYQIGALRALNNFIPSEEIKFISCASVGVLNGYAYVTGNLSSAEKMWRNVCNGDARIFISQMLRSSMLQQNIANLYDPMKVIPATFFCSLLDISHRSVVYKDISTAESSLIPQYLKASVAMPVYNRSVQLDGTFYFDGAMIDNIPVFPLMKYNLDYIICIYFDDICYRFENVYFDNKIIKITFPCGNGLKQSVVFRQESIDDMIQKGYDRTMCLLRTIFLHGHDSLDHIYRTIERTNETNPNTAFRITGDVLVTNLNKITQRLTRKKIL